MRIVHRVGLNADSRDQRELARIGVSIDLGVGAFEVDEADVHWPEIEAWARKRKAVLKTWTEFTSDEIDSASWAFFGAYKVFGYPQPRASFREATYDLTQSCAICGVGAIQRAPFRMKGEPNWGDDEILQLNLIYDELFVKPETWHKVFEPLGVGYRDVLDTQGVPLSTVLQIDVDKLVDVTVAPETGTTCPTCGQVKYAVHTRGRFPRPLSEPESHVVRTRQYFGVGGINAWRPILGSKHLIRSLIEHGIRTSSFWPVAEST